MEKLEIDYNIDKSFGELTKGTDYPDLKAAFEDGCAVQTVAVGGYWDAEDLTVYAGMSMILFDKEDRELSQVDHLGYDEGTFDVARFTDAEALMSHIVGTSDVAVAEGWIDDLPDNMELYAVARSRDPDLDPKCNLAGVGYVGYETESGGFVVRKEGDGLSFAELDENGWTQLCAAYEGNGHFDLFKAASALRDGFGGRFGGTNAHDWKGAAEQGHSEIKSLLLAAGADPTKIDDGEESSLGAPPEARRRAI